MKKVLLVIVVIAALAAALIIAGKDSGDTNAGERDRAFLQAMVPHHESAIAMANIAKQQAETEQMRKLALDIIEAQEREIAQMRRIHERLFDEELSPDERAHETLGLSASEAGMNHGPESQKELRTADPFDRAFIDEMTPHHEGAIRMARAILETTTDGELQRLARSIIDAQEKEIELMEEARFIRFGPASPEPSGTPAGLHEGH